MFPSALCVLWTDETSRRWVVGDRHVRGVSGIAIVGVFLAFIAASPASGQVLYGGITGTVTDSTGGTVPAATVTITHKETNLSRETVTNDSGIYTFTNVQAGAYDIKVSLSGFREFVQTNVPVSVNQISRVDVKLDVGALTETVTVQSAAELLQTDKADVHTELKSAEITSLPLNQFRNYQALINLVPGATPGVFQNAETDTPARSLSTNVNGQNRNNNGTRTDGATNVNIWLPHHNVYVSPAETIDTVNISTNNFDAEQGMAGGAAVTVITKSGTNQFKGSAFEFYNSDKLNATPYFFGNDPNGKPPKLPITRNIYGGTVGGPIQRNRLFFFGSFEGYKQDLKLLQLPERAERGAARRRFQQRPQRERVPADHLRPADRQPRRHGPDAISQQHHSRGPAPPDRREAQRLLPAAKLRRHRSRQSHEQLPARGTADDRSRQLRRQDQLQPHADASDLGQVQPYCARLSTI